MKIELGSFPKAGTVQTKTFVFLETEVVFSKALSLFLKGRLRLFSAVG